MKTILARLVKPDMHLRFGKHDEEGFLVGEVWHMRNGKVRLIEQNTAEVREVPKERRLASFS